MPIKNLSENSRMPRLGKIHLGYKHPEKGYPIKTDYFVLPADHPDYKLLVEKFGDKPKELRILIPGEDEELWCEQYYKAYDMTRGLICKGDGETAMRMLDIKTGYLPNKDTGTVTMKEITCAGKECPEYKAKKCGETMNLRFMLPEVPGLGVWQIDTGSINSILNINSNAKLIKSAFKRVSMIPLSLTLEPIEVNNPETKKKQTVFVLNLRSRVTLSQLAAAAREQSKTLLLSAPNWDEVMDKQAEADIEELYGDGEQKQKIIDSTPQPVVENPESKAAFDDLKSANPAAMPAAEKVTTPEPKQDKKPAALPTNPGELCTWAYKHGKTYNMTWICKQLNVNQPDEIKDIPNAIATLKELTGWTDEIEPNSRRGLKG
jgi:hypothetical protein